MQTIGAFEAKTHFSEILNRVEQGQTVVITRHGHKIATLAPIGDLDKPSDRGMEGLAGAETESTVS